MSKRRHTIPFLIAMLSCGCFGSNLARLQREAHAEREWDATFKDAQQGLADAKDREGVSGSMALYNAMHFAYMDGLIVRSTLGKIDKEQKSGEWPIGLKYRGKDGVTWDEATAFAYLRDTRTRLDAYKADFEKRYDAEMRKVFPNPSPAQVEWLHKYGPPSVDAQCWVRNGRVITKTCWTPAGAVASSESYADPNASASDDRSSGSSSQSSQQDTNCSANGSDVAASSYCCSGKARETLNDPKNPSSGHVAWICCGSKNGAATDSCR